MRFRSAPLFIAMVFGVTDAAATECGFVKENQYYIRGWMDYECSQTETITVPQGRQFIVLQIYDSYSTAGSEHI